MLLDNIKGYERLNKLREDFEIELEAVCLNSSYFSIKDITKKMRIIKDICAEYEKNTLFKESEIHSYEKPYYEFSFFCNKEDINFFKKMLEEKGIEVDLIHDNVLGDIYDDGSDI